MSFKDFFMSWGMLLIGILMNVFGMYVVKARINVIGAAQLNSFKSVAGFFVSIFSSPLAIFGGIIVVLACFPYAIALSKMQLSIAYPLSIALTCMMMVPLTALFLGESITFNKIMAISMIIGSLYFLYK